MYQFGYPRGTGGFSKSQIRLSVIFPEMLDAVKRLTKVRIVLNSSTPPTFFNRRNFKSRFQRKE